jgi:hypothetical protein
MTTTILAFFETSVPTLPFMLEEVRGWKVDQGWAEYALSRRHPARGYCLYGQEFWEPFDATPTLAAKPVSAVTPADLRALRRAVRKEWGNGSVARLDEALSEALEVAAGVGWLEPDQLLGLVSSAALP